MWLDLKVTEYKDNGYLILGKQIYLIQLIVLIQQISIQIYSAVINLS